MEVSFNPEGLAEAKFGLQRFALAQLPCGLGI